MLQQGILSWSVGKDKLQRLWAGIYVHWAQWWVSADMSHTQSTHIQPDVPETKHDHD